MKKALELAILELARGNFVLVYDIDGREEEVDLVCLATKCSSKHVYQLRHDAGGLICVAMHHKIALNLGLPFMSEVYSQLSNEYTLFNLIMPINNDPYGDKPSFSITINHVDTYTGITDQDRSLTIRKFGLLGNYILLNDQSNFDYQEYFGKNFRSPGHTHLLIANQDLINARQGHTELTITLACLGGLSPVTVLCEMLDNKTGKALSIENAGKYSKKNNLVMIEGVDIIEAYKETLNNSELCYIE